MIHEGRRLLWTQTIDALWAAADARAQQRGAVPWEKYRNRHPRAPIDSRTRAGTRTSVSATRSRPVRSIAPLRTRSEHPARNRSVPAQHTERKPTSPTTITEDGAVLPRWADGLGILT